MLFSLIEILPSLARSDGKNRTKLRPKALPETHRTEARSTFTGVGWLGRWRRMCNSNPSATLMSDSARQPAVEMFVTVASPSISSDQKPSEHRKSTRRAFLIFRSFPLFMDPRYLLCESACSRMLMSGVRSLVHAYEVPMPPAA